MTGCSVETNASNPCAPDNRTLERSRRGMPIAVYALSAGIFSMTTAEFMVAGLLPSLSAAFGVSVAKIGYLISIYSAGMVIGGPLLTMALLSCRYTTVLIRLLAAFVVGQVLAATAVSYTVLAIARAITGITSAAFLAIALSAAAELAGPHSRGRASSIVLAGLMVATVLGLPLAAVIDQQFGWRASFWAVAILVTLCMGLLAGVAPTTSQLEHIDLPAELTALKNARLWMAYATSGLIIAATFAAFSYLSPIFTEISGFTPRAIPALFMAYGAATVIGNTVVGRFADRYTLLILSCGLAALSATLFFFALLAHSARFTIVATVILGLVGVTMNPAMAVRIMRIGNPRPLVNAMHGAIISLGVLTGSWLGGAFIDAGFGLRAPLWVGAALAVLGLCTLASRGLRE